MLVKCVWCATRAHGDRKQKVYTEKTLGQERKKKKKRENKPNKSKLKKKNLEISKRHSNKWDQEHRFENSGIIKKYGLKTH